MDTIFELRDVSFTYGDKVFRPSQRQPEHPAKATRSSIMGANGSGKSTLLSILDALVYPTSGEFLAFGKPVTEDVFDSTGRQ